MNRRHFLIAAGAAALPLPALAAVPAPVEYTPGLIDAELAAGKTVFVDFKAEWCSTCARQERVIEALRGANPAYEAITFVNVDWDQYKRDAFTKRLRIPRRSTLIALKGDEELGRIVAGTGEAEIKALLDKALGAATS